MGCDGADAGSVESERGRLGNAMTATAKRRATIASRRALFEEAAAIIALEYPGELSLEEVARRLFTSPRQLQRAFAEAGATGFREHLRRVRMDHAAELLREGLPVRDVGKAVGYRQPAQFAKAFRREFGESPSSARSAARVGP